MSRGRFITMEGVEGVGKSTNLVYLESLLEARGIGFQTTREPGGTLLGERIRQLLLDKNESNMKAMTELLLMFAARAQHVEEFIKPTLAEGQWVVCDRFTDSSFAYQGGGRGIPVEKIQQLEQLFLQDCKPDLTLLLDLPTKVGLARASIRSDPDRFELEGDAFFKQVRAAFLSRADAEPERFRVVDASQPLGEVQDQIKQLMDDWFGALKL